MHDPQHINNPQELIRNGNEKSFQFHRLFGRLMGYPDERINSFIASQFTPDKIRKFPRRFRALPKYRETRAISEIKRRQTRTVRKHHRILGLMFKPTVGSLLKPMQHRRIK